jgi:5S rRNA maturation endonuclease (ribonuclease M5)
MDSKDLVKFYDKQIKELEKSVWVYETIVRPRFEQDKKTLETLREQYLKLMVLLDKKKRGESISNVEVNECIPELFR